MSDGTLRHRFPNKLAAFGSQGSSCGLDSAPGVPVPNRCTQKLRFSLKVLSKSDRFSGRIPPGVYHRATGVIVPSLSTPPDLSRGSTPGPGAIRAASSMVLARSRAGMRGLCDPESHNPYTHPKSAGFLTRLSGDAIILLADTPSNRAPVAQGIEQRTSNPWVAGSIPARRPSPTRTSRRARW